MAYISQEQKKIFAPKIKALAAKYKVKATLGIRNHMTLVLTISSGELDFIGDYNEKNKDREFFQLRENYLDVNTYYIDDAFTGKVADFLNEALAIMNNGNHDNSDIQTDYFDVGWYNTIHIGRWPKPYQLVKE